MKFNIKHDFTKSQPAWNSRYSSLYGTDNQGAIVYADSPKHAIEIFNSEKLAGEKVNPFYLKVTQISA